MHCFTGSQAMAEEALAAGFHISFSGILTFKNSDALREIARLVPFDRLLVETDAPYLAPVPQRGRRNEPAFIAHTAAALAAVKAVSPEEIARRTTANFIGLFQRTAAVLEAAG
jgi:TatD DNase family protein